MLDFTDVEPYAPTRRVIQQIDFYSQGSFAYTTATAPGTYTPGQLLKTITANMLADVRVSWDTDAKANNEFEFNMLRSEFPAANPYICVLREYQRDASYTPTASDYNRILSARWHSWSNVQGSLLRLVSCSSSLLSEDTYIGVKTPDSDLYYNAFSGPRAKWRSAFVTLGGPDAVRENTNMYSLEKLNNVVMWINGAWAPGQQFGKLTVSDAIKAYNASLSDYDKYLRGIYYQEYNGSQGEEAQYGIPYLVNYINVNRLPTNIRIGQRRSVNGDVYIYFTRAPAGFPEAPLPTGALTLTADDYENMTYASNANYGKVYTVNFRGDNRLELGDLVTTAAFTNRAIKSISVEWDGTKKSAIVM